MILIKTLEIWGIEGSFRTTCENIMRVVRENRESLIVILAAFAHDLVINFRSLIPFIITKQNTNESNKDKNDDIKENIIDNQKNVERKNK